MGTAMSRAFLAAGTRRVISSQWPVADASTACLMEHFYRGIAPAIHAGRKPDYAVALQEARRKLREESAYREDPFFWAPFVLIGPAE
jgi:CHAT domain-containing protein